MVSFSLLCIFYLDMNNNNRDQITINIALECFRPFSVLKFQLPYNLFMSTLVMMTVFYMYLQAVFIRSL